MGKPYKRTGPPAAVLQQVSSSPQTAPLEEESPPQQHSVDLGDTSAIKRTLDDVAVQVGDAQGGARHPHLWHCCSGPKCRTAEIEFLAMAAQEVLSSGHKENFTVSNIKIGLGLFT